MDPLYRQPPIGDLGGSHDRMVHEGCNVQQLVLGDRREGGVYSAKETVEKPMKNLKGKVFAWIKFR